jgi:hypothetical protein
MVASLLGKENPLLRFRALFLRLGSAVMIAGTKWTASLRVASCVIFGSVYVSYDHDIALVVAGNNLPIRKHVYY